MVDETKTEGQVKERCEKCCRFLEGIYKVGESKVCSSCLPNSDYEEGGEDPPFL